eukprot:584144-Pyramimonas_sp.AAC.1
MRSEVEAIKQQLAMAEAQLPFDVENLATWDRAVDPHIFSIGVVAPASPQAVNDALAGWIADAKLQRNQIELVGDVVARRFTVRVLGSKAEASSRATALVRSLRTSTGWRSFNVVSTEGAMVAMYVSTDKSPKMVRGEVQAKRMCKLLEDAYPSLTWR